MILSPKCLCPAAKLLVVQWRLQTIDRLKTDENEAKQKSMQRLEANEMLNRACKNYAQSSLSLFIIEHKDF